MKPIQRTVQSHQLEDYSFIASRGDKCLEPNPSTLDLCTSVYQSLLEAHSRLQRRDYQPYYAALYLQRQRNICAGSMGVGKTIIAGLTIATLFDLSTARPGSVHVVAPSLASANLVWVEDLSLFPQLRDYIEVIQTERQAANSTKPIWIYQMDFPKQRSRTLKHTTRPFMSRLLYRLHRCPLYLVVDELHHFRHNSLRTQHLSYVKRRTPRILGLSGTLSDGRLTLIHQALKFVYGSLWPMSEGEFLRRFAMKTQATTNYLTGTEVSNLVQQRYLEHIPLLQVPTYHALVKSKLHRLTLNDRDVRSCIKLPYSPPPTTYTLPMASDHRARYVALVQQHAEALTNLQRNRDGIQARAQAFSLFQPLLECSNAPLDLVPAKLLKLKELLIDAQQQGLKTIIYTSMVSVGRMLTQYLSEQFGNQSLVRLYAQDDQATPKNLSFEAREVILQRLLYEPEVDFGVLSINLASESLNLTRISRVIYYDLPWDSLKVSQSLCRCIRPGAIREPIEVFYLNHERTIDEHKYNLVMESFKHAQLLLDYDAGDLPALQAVNPLALIEEILQDAL